MNATATPYTLSDFLFDLWRLFCALNSAVLAGALVLWLLTFIPGGK